MTPFSGATSESKWPYNLPIWRRFHRAVSPDGQLVAQIDPAHEVSMGNPTSGILCISNGLHIERCNPSFIWSDDSKFLAVPQYFKRFVIRRQRLIVISFEKRAAYASKTTAYYFQPESFTAGRLVVSVNPSRGKRTIEFHIPDELKGAFTWRWQVAWPETSGPADAK